jgi:hypothetical protein
LIVTRSFLVSDVDGLNLNGYKHGKSWENTTFFYLVK